MCAQYKFFYIKILSGQLTDGLNFFLCICCKKIAPALMLLANKIVDDKAVSIMLFFNWLNSLLTMLLSCLKMILLSLRPGVRINVAWFFIWSISFENWTFDINGIFHSLPKGLMIICGRFWHFFFVWMFFVSDIDGLVGVKNVQPVFQSVGSRFPSPFILRINSMPVSR